MRPRIAIPVVHSTRTDYAERSLPQYTRALELAGAEPVVIPLDVDPEEIARRVTGCDAVLLPGSAADVDPQKYGAARHPKTADGDPGRDAADELLLQDAYNLRKPILGICYGLQILNVYRSGTLVQHLDPEIVGVNHAAGRAVAQAHTVEIDPVSRLAGYIGARAGERMPVNSSHHQAVDTVGDGLTVVARCREGNPVIEAVEGTSPDHFVLGVQWHPERSYEEDPASRAIFGALVEAAEEYARQHR